MDGTWYLRGKSINYLICPACKELVKKDDITKRKDGICWKCSEV